MSGLKKFESFMCCALSSVCRCMWDVCYVNSMASTWKIFTHKFSSFLYQIEAEYRVCHMKDTYTLIVSLYVMCQCYNHNV